MPTLEHARGTATAVSRLLRKSGFLMCGKDENDRRTEGFHVHVIGYSRTVAVSYHYKLGDAEMKERSKEAMSKMFALLASKGYPVDSRGWIECERN